MKKNRLLSAFLAGALMVSAMPFQAFAAPEPDITNPPAGGGTITGDSTVVSQAEVKVVVPANTDFLVNPLELDVSGVSDQIISTPFTFINKSNMDVQLSVSPEFTSDSGITVASSPDEIKNTIGEAPTIFLQVAPATTKPDLKGAGDTLEFDDATTPTFTSGDGISTTVTEEADGVTPNTTYFKLENLKKAYSVDTVTDPTTPKMEYDPNKALPADTDAVAVKFVGKVSQMSTWTGIAPKVKFHYEFNLISKEVYADSSNEVAGAHGLVNKDLTETTSLTLDADGNIKLVLDFDTYKTTAIGYIGHNATMPYTDAQLIEAIENAGYALSPDISMGTLDGKVKAIRAYAKGTDYDWTTQESSYRIGNLTSSSLQTMSGKYMRFVTVAVNRTDDTDKFVIISPEVQLN